MIGYVIRSSARDVFVYALKSLVRVHSAKLACPSEFNMEFPLSMKHELTIFCVCIFCSGLFFDKYLKHIKLAEDFVQFTKINMSYLLKVQFNLLSQYHKSIMFNCLL